MATQTDAGIPLSAVNPNFLHSNSTSHTWPFSAIAELIDNAYDPDVRAKQLWIDKTQIRGEDCLTFMDNGAGMDYDAMYKLLSFGFSDKQSVEGHAAVGMYGNGFKSGSMRLGKDAIVFSKKHDSMCVGMLSQTYLETTKATNIIVPIVSYTYRGERPHMNEEHLASLQDILKYSLFQTQEELQSELKAINATTATNTSGTRIIIWNLRRTASGKLEFDFDADRYDIKIPADVSDGTQTKFKRTDRNTPTEPEMDSSLRAYCSILYLKPKMQIIIRGQKVKTQLISKSLAYIAKDKYKPNFITNKQNIPIIFGYITERDDNYGVMMYHKNRLIKAYERVGCQRKANIRGVGVIGVIECNFLKPTHNKQDFDDTDEYRKTIYTLGLKLEEYWKEIQHKRKKLDPDCPPVEDIEKRPDQTWVECDKCQKWRKLPDGINSKCLPELWYCHMNPDPRFRSCEVEQESPDSEDEQSTYKKTYKQEERRNKEISRQQEQTQKEQQLNQMVTLAKQNEILQLQKKCLQKQLRRTRASVRWSASSETLSQVPAVSMAGNVSPANSSNSISPHAGPSSTSCATPRNSTPVRARRTPRTNMDGMRAKRLKTDSDGNDNGNASTVPMPMSVESGVGVSEASEEERDCLEMIANMPTECLDNEMDTACFLGEAPSPNPEKKHVAIQTEIQMPVKMEKDDEGSDGEEKGNKRKTEGQETEGRGFDSMAHIVEETTNAELQTAESHMNIISGCLPNPLIKVELHDQGQRRTPDISAEPREGVHGERLIQEAQTQQDHLLELLEVTAQERDNSKRMLDGLSSQVDDLQKQLQDLKRECEELRNQRSELVQDRMEHKKAKGEMSEATVLSHLQQLNEVIDDLGRATMEAEECNSRRPGEDKTQNTEVNSNKDDGRVDSASNWKEKNDGDGDNTQSDDHSSKKSDAELKLNLNRLRRLVGRLLVSIIPSLDLQQIDYDNNVIDEILDNVLTEISQSEKADHVEDQPD
ncbi:MORC family CW-type zinc finger protein 3-like isoform X2 [Denticeps clupeoides]|uniref:CW-type domain-containing protein n=1 Tax=Denticeps clupeoides TaxID=299321 RepID=A0AAY4D9B4_9TELE|nr:MORC family CW-type zinc finger protein 3-like isoform X2 [Denticeps clupeoides]